MKFFRRIFYSSYQSDYKYARRLAIDMWQNHYTEDSPDWLPCGDLSGVLSQIDNMLTGLTRK